MISLTSSLVVEKTKYFPYKTHYENQNVCYIIGKKKMPYKTENVNLLVYS